MRPIIAIALCVLCGFMGVVFAGPARLAPTPADEKRRANPPDTDGKKGFRVTEPVAVPMVPIPERRTEDNTMQIVGVVVVVLGGAIALIAWRRSQRVAFIRIVGVPSGEAPSHIRSAWVGIELPLSRHWPQPVTATTTGAMSGDNPGFTTGFAVDGPKAVELLESYNATAAKWWHDNVPQVHDPGHVLVFTIEVCERVK